MKSLNTFIIASAVAAMAFISPAHAEAAAGQEGGFASLIPLLLIMVIFYFLLIRPQQKKLREHRELVDSLKKGDKVLTGGGIFGKITAVKDDVLNIEIADGVVIKAKRDTVAGLAETTPAPAKEKADKKEKTDKE